MMLGPHMPFGAPGIHPHMPNPMMSPMIQHKMHMEQKLHHMKHKMQMDQKMQMQKKLLLKQEMQMKMAHKMNFMKPQPVFYPKPLQKPFFKKEMPMMKPKIKNIKYKIVYVKPPKKPVVWNNVGYRRVQERPVSNLPVPVFRGNVFTGYRPAPRTQRVDLPRVSVQRPVYQPQPVVKPPTPSTPPQPQPYQPVQVLPAQREYSAQEVQQQPAPSPRQVQWSQVAHGAFNYDDDDDDDDDDDFDDDDKFEDYWEDRFDDWKDRIEDRLEKKPRKYYDDNDDDKFDDFERKEYQPNIEDNGRQSTIQQTIRFGKRPVYSTKYLEEISKGRRKYEENKAEIERKDEYRNMRMQQPYIQRGDSDFQRAIVQGGQENLYSGYVQPQSSNFQGRHSTLQNDNMQWNQGGPTGHQSMNVRDRNPAAQVITVQHNSILDNDNSDIQVQHSIAYRNTNDKYKEDSYDKKKNYVDPQNYSESRTRNVGSQNTIFRNSRAMAYGKN